ncbi:MAG TPA: GYF domain-containing protein [Candidatus Wunengus sp. YC63]|uniref:GYF domain-containing protein n=1 Tax=Candidatus Wunengus sp. YC63 TaxID=3367699 RepID=UPI004027A74D
MTERCWYYVKDNKPVGPISESKLYEMFHTGNLSVQTLVWTQPMSNWMPASNVESFRLKASKTMVFSVQQQENVLRHVSMKQARLLRFKGTGFQNIWWGLVAGVSALFIIPAAWGAVLRYRWFVRNVEFSDGTTASFEGRGKEVWHYFIGIGLLEIVIPILCNAIVGPKADLFVFMGLPFATVAIWLQIMRWFFSKIKLSCGTNMKFCGRYWSFLGWSMLVMYSVITIIGWAWASVAMLRWVCRNIDAGPHRLVFTGGGWSLLWRGILAALASCFILPIPWMEVWIIRWFARNMMIEQKTS